ncbi:hypothetical protein OTB20_41080 [Streptomyces sp. H27-H1]|uniref:hypothetical protein n=1 Tax=Streptomyces sp. H27-H1 TaxID=2996461 RepID=UPI00226EFA9E|nr:hypothetical protein [Streptomyces sp. H27-H1]MCY0932431.1 hypothetical protein [Streptomyces sp. H27-H1]
MAGLEGLVVKNMTQPYRPAARSWTKIRRRDTTEAIIGAITGTLTRPGFRILGRHDQAGRLRTVGRTTALRPDGAREVAEHLAPPAPATRGRVCGSRAAWGSRDVLDAVLVRPDLVAEISADRAVDHGGVYRHPLRFKRLRQDVEARDVAGFGQGPATAVG